MLTRKMTIFSWSDFDLSFSRKSLEETWKNILFPLPRDNQGVENTKIPGIPD